MLIPIFILLPSDIAKFFAFSFSILLRKKSYLLELGLIPKKIKVSSQILPKWLLVSLFVK